MNDILFSFRSLTESLQWNGLSEQDQNNLIYNVVWHLGQASDMDIRIKQCRIFQHVNETLGQAIANGVNVTL
jgi:catalase